MAGWVFLRVFFQMMEENSFLVNPCGFALGVPWQEGQAASSSPSFRSQPQEQPERWDKDLVPAPSHLCAFCSPFVLPSQSCRALVFPRAAG